MKKLLIVLITLFVLIGGVLLFAASRAGAILESYKPELEKMASESLGAGFTFPQCACSH